MKVASANGKLRWPWNFHPFATILNKKDSDCHVGYVRLRRVSVSIFGWSFLNLFFAKLKVRSARGFNRWTRLHQTITFKCPPCSRIWSTATTRWGRCTLLVSWVIVISTVRDAPSESCATEAFGCVRLNAPFSWKMKNSFFSNIGTKPTTTDSHLQHVFLRWQIKDHISYFLSCNLGTAQLLRKMTPHHGRNARERWRRMRRRRKIDGWPRLKRAKDQSGSSTYFSGSNVKGGISSIQSPNWQDAYIPGIYCLLGGYETPTTYRVNINFMVRSPNRSLIY